MKFTELADEFENLVKRRKKGKKVRPKKLKELRQLLMDKQSHYEKKLKSSKDDEESKKLKTRLKVVDAQIKKTDRLLSDD